MLIWVSWFIMGMLFSLLYCYLFCKLVCNKVFKIDLKVLIFSIGLAIVNCILLNENVVYLKPIILELYCFVEMRYLYKYNFSKTVVGSLMVYILIVISEMIFSVIGVFILQMSQNFVKNDPLGIIIANILICLIAYILSNNKFVKNLVSTIIKWQNEKEKFVTIIIYVILAFIITFFIYQNFIDIFSKQYFILSNVFFISVLILIFVYFGQKTDNSKLLHDYDNLLEYSKEYEKEVIDKSKKQHEYKNQLVIIESMVSEKDKKVKDYINKLIDENSDNKDFHLIKTLSYIKSDGLKGLIYYKLKQMKRKKINATVNISEQLNDDSIWTVCNDNLQDISRCLGVYIDNAIEASEISNDKYFMIEVALDEENIIFSISNTFKENVDLAKIEKEGYSSKGKGRGFGLSLVKGIIDTNKYLNSEREICGKYYIQSLYIKRK